MTSPSEMERKATIRTVKVEAVITFFSMISVSEINTQLNVLIKICNKNCDIGNEHEVSSSESEDSEDTESKYGLELAELTNEISIKQKLIEELERSQQKLHSMKQHYEEKLLQLQERIRATQEERDKVLASFAGQNNQPSDKVSMLFVRM